MCIIVVCEEKAPTIKFLERCERENPHGGGIAWRKGNVVNYAKGLTAKQIYDMLLDEELAIQLPYVIHFRITSSGSGSKELNHPFPISVKAETDLVGSSGKGVLFHNGTWQEWRGLLYRTFPKPLPNGEWNDSRAMAYIASQWGLNWLQLPASYNRICVFTPTKIRLFGYWVRENGYTLSHTMNYGNLNNVSVTDKPYTSGSLNTSFIPNMKVSPVRLAQACDPSVDSIPADDRCATIDGQPEPPAIIEDPIDDESDQAEIRRFLAQQGIGDENE